MRNEHLGRWKEWNDKVWAGALGGRDRQTLKWEWQSYCYAKIRKQFGHEAKRTPGRVFAKITDLPDWGACHSGWGKEGGTDMTQTCSRSHTLFYMQSYADTHLLGRTQSPTCAQTPMQRHTESRTNTHLDTRMIHSHAHRIPPYTHMHKHTAVRH